MVVRLSETKFRTCRGYHVYQNDWIPVLGEGLQCSHEIGNTYDPYAVKVTEDNTTVGHLPKKISLTYLFFIRKEGTIHCEVMDLNRKYPRELVQGGLEIYTPGPS